MAAKGAERLFEGLCDMDVVGDGLQVAAAENGVGIDAIELNGDGHGSQRGLFAEASQEWLERRFQPITEFCFVHGSHLCQCGNSARGRRPF